MGVVYEAEQESLGRRVALKVLPAAALPDPKQVRRFEREARAAARLHHTNIVPVFGVGEHEGTHYYVMQFIQGQGLDAVLDELKRLRRRPGPARPAGPTAAGGGRRSRGGRRRPVAGDRPVRGRPTAADGDRPAGPRRPTSPWTVGDPPCRSRPPPPVGLGRLEPSGRLAASRRSRRPTAATAAGRGPDRRAGGRGPGVRPRPGHPPPRHQAVEPAAGHATATSG